MEEKKKTLKEKVSEFVYGVKRKVRTFNRWVSEDPARAVGVFVAVLTGIGACASGSARLINKVDAIHDRHDERCRVWDPSMGVYWYTKKPMSTQQRLEFESRVQKGENRGEVLEDMRILNKRK